MTPVLQVTQIDPRTTPISPINPLLATGGDATVASLQLELVAKSKDYEDLLLAVGMCDNECEEELQVAQTAIQQLEERLRDAVQQCDRYQSTLEFEQATTQHLKTIISGLKNEISGLDANHKQKLIKIELERDRIQATNDMLVVSAVPSRSQAALEIFLAIALAMSITLTYNYRSLCAENWILAK